MKTKGLAIESIQEMAENRAQRWQISGCSSASHTRIELQDRNAGRRQRITLWRCLILLFVVGLPAILCAQKQQGSWSNLNGLKAGQGIEVIESSRRRHAGEFLSVTDETLTLQEKGSDVSVNRKDVVRVSTASGAGAASMRLSVWSSAGLLGRALALPLDRATVSWEDLRAESRPWLALRLAPRAGLRSAL